MKLNRMVQATLAICTLWSFGSPGLAQDAPDQVIYSGGLSPDWTDTSWAPHKITQTDVTHNGKPAISIDFTHSSGFYLTHAPFQAAHGAALSFFLNGGPSGGQVFKVHAITGGKSTDATPSLLITPYLPGGRLNPDTWVQVSIPLDKLGVADAPNLSGFWFQDCLFIDQATLYVADIALVPADRPLAAPVQEIPPLPPPGPPFNVNVTVDASQTLNTVTAPMLGLNFGSGSENSLTPDFVKLLKAAGVASMRFPGGSFSDRYDWTAGLDTKGKKLPNGAPQFAALATASGVAEKDVFVTLNYGSGTPQMAAAWVAYANGSVDNRFVIGQDDTGRDWKTAAYWAGIRAANPLPTDDGLNALRAGHPAPYGIGHFELGNECYGSWEADQHPQKHDPVLYAHFVQATLPMIRAIDPTARVGIVLTQDIGDGGDQAETVTNPVTGKPTSGWTTVLLTTLAQTGTLPDEGIIHWYPFGSKHEDDAQLLDAPEHKWNNWSGTANRLRPLLNACFGPAKAAQFQLVCTECNSVSDLPGKQSVSIVDALFYADAFGTLLHSEFKALTWFCARGGTQMWWNNSPTLYGWRHYGDYGMLATHDPNNPTFTPPGGDEDTPYPTYFALKLITQFAHPGDAVIAASSDNPLLTVYACRRPGHLTLLLVNKSQNSDADATCSLSGVQVTGVGRTLEYGKVQDFAQEHGAAVDLVEGSAVVTGHTVEVNVPAYTVAVIDVP